MKKFTSFKVVQLSLLIVFTLLGTYLLTKPAIKSYVFSSKPATILFILFWIILLSGYVFILIDLKLIANIKVGEQTLYDAAHSDQITHLPNRFSCDTIIEKYADKILPSDIACVMIDLTNLAEINKNFGHTTGNQVLKEFSSILGSASVSLCFVGRNGGNKFLSVFEKCDNEKIHAFLDRVEKRVTKYNAENDSVTIYYNYGIAYNQEDNVSSITELIGLANKRIYGDQ